MSLPTSPEASGEKSLRQEGEERELLLLHPRAFRSSLSAGRELPEEPDSLKNPFQIDRSRSLWPTG